MQDALRPKQNLKKHSMILTKGAYRRKTGQNIHNSGILRNLECLSEQEAGKPFIFTKSFLEKQIPNKFKRFFQGLSHDSECIDIGSSAYCERSIYKPGIDHKSIQASACP